MQLLSGGTRESKLPLNVLTADIYGKLHWNIRALNSTQPWRNQLVHTQMLNSTPLFEEVHYTNSVFFFDNKFATNFPKRNGWGNAAPGSYTDSHHH